MWKVRSPAGLIPRPVIWSQEADCLSIFKHHVFVCHNTRPEGAPRPSCTTDGKSELHSSCNNLPKRPGWETRCASTSRAALINASTGPTVVVYPEAVWYGHVRLEDAAEIVQEHLVNGRPVERLRLAEECINTKSCPHRS